MGKLFCFFFGHQPTDVDENKSTARCRECGKLLRVSYDAIADEITIKSFKHSKENNHAKR